MVVHNLRFYSKFKTTQYNKITVEVFVTFPKAIEKLDFRSANSQVRANNMSIISSFKLQQACEAYL
jgi:hypothetical protein